MKKIFLNLSAVAIMGLALTACNNEEANKKAAEADQVAIQTLVDDKAAAIDAEVAKACEEQVLAAAQATVDSLNAAATKGGKKPVAVVKKPVVKPVEKTTNQNKKDGMMNGGKTVVTKEDTKKKDGMMDGGQKVPVTKEDTKKKDAMMGGK